MFAWKFKDDEPILAVKYLSSLVEVLLSNKVISFFRKVFWPNLRDNKNHYRREKREHLGVGTISKHGIKLQGISVLLIKPAKAVLYRKVMVFHCCQGSRLIYETIRITIESKENTSASAQHPNMGLNFKGWRSRKSHGSQGSQEDQRDREDGRDWANRSEGLHLAGFSVVVSPARLQACKPITGVKISKWWYTGLS